MKKIIRLTESDLHDIIKESVNRILKEGFDKYSDEDFANDSEMVENFNPNGNVINERTKGEKGMNDDEVMRRRNDNFRKDMDARHKDPFSPNYSDREEMEGWYHTPEEMELKTAHDRRMLHNRKRIKK